MKSQNLKVLFLRLIVFIAVLVAMAMILTGTDAITKMAVFKTEVRHIGFLKVHKAASTTIQNILIRFSRSRSLTAMLPRDGNHLGARNPSPKTWRLMSPPKNKTFDILFNHVIFNAVGFRTFLPSDSVYIASIREPFQQMISAFYYIRSTFTTGNIRNISGPNPHRKYLLNPQKYDRGKPLITRNGMARDFGYPMALSEDLKQFQTYLDKLGKFFHLVIVMENFEESIILMRRLLNWSIKDVIYIKTNVIKLNSSIVLTDQDRQLHREMATLDYILYDYFRKKLEEQLAEQGDDFWKEVGYFRELVKSVEQFCDKGKNSTMGVASSKYTGSFHVSKSDCDVMMMKEGRLLELMKDEREKNVQKYGDNSLWAKKKRQSIVWTPAIQLDV